VKYRYKKSTIELYHT